MTASRAYIIEIKKKYHLPSISSKKAWDVNLKVTIITIKDALRKMKKYLFWDQERFVLSKFLKCKVSYHRLI